MIPRRPGFGAINSDAVSRSSIEGERSQCQCENMLYILRVAELKLELRLSADRLADHEQQAAGDRVQRRHKRRYTYISRIQNSVSRYRSPSAVS